MTAFVLPNLDQSTIDELRKRIPDLSEIDLPKLESVGKDVGKTADQALDRLLGRSRAPVWPWVAGSIALVAVLGAVAAWFTWFRRPTDTLVDDDMTSWKPSTTEADTSGDISGIATDHTIDSQTSDALGTFGARTADEYPIAER